MSFNNNHQITLDEFEKLIEEINNHTVLVEGKSDKKAMNSVGVSDVVSISGKSFERIINGFDKKKRVLVLTDFDKEGKEMAKKISNVLQRLGTKTNTSLRKRIHKATRIAHVSEFEKVSAGFKKFTGDDYHGEITAIDNKVYYRSTD